jgi:hypothetical protein
MYIRNDNFNSTEDPDGSSRFWRASWVRIY